ncbi:MAG: hypothetical protein GY787_20625 [Alteromonadales bacterium]|nr:hypothetical protein [Alteromonadales bacterium]
MKFQHSLLALLVTGTLAACGGSSKKTDSLPEQLIPQLSTLEELITNDGINWFNGQGQKADNISLKYGTISLTADESFDIESYRLNSNKTAFELIEEEFIATDSMMLSEGQWQDTNNTLTNITSNNDGSLTFKKSSSALDEVVTAEEVEITDEVVANILAKSTNSDAEAWATIIPEDIKFGDDTTAYKLTYKQAAENFGFYKGEWCKGTPRYETLGEMCNGVVYEPYGDLNETDRVWATTFNDLITHKEYVIGEDYYTEFHGTGISWNNSEGSAVYVEFTESGSANYYFVDWSNGPEIITEKLATGTWSEITVQNTALIKITAPDNITVTNSSFNPADRTMYLSPVEGHIRVIWSLGETERSEYAFDKATKEYILQNMNLSLLSPL